jgi:nucleoside-diphosphate-sugar epimerase
MSLCPAQLAESIKQHIPDFRIDYQVDPVRQGIADTWPRAMDDSAARQDWGWQEQYDLEATTREMLSQLRAANADRSASG